MRKIIGLALAAALASTLPVLAETTPKSTPQGMMMQNGMMQGSMMQGGMMRGMMGMHVMPVTVTAIDAQTGLVDGTSGGMALKLHFPPASLAGVKAGDRLSVHLGFSKL
jgi:hypothetical protein